MEKVTSQQFKDGLSGVYGHIDAKVFEKHKTAVIYLQDNKIRLVGDKSFA